MSRRSTALHVALGVLLALNLLLAAWPGGWPVVRAQGPVSGSEPGAGAQSAPPAGQPRSRLPSLSGLDVPSQPGPQGRTALPGRAIPSQPDATSPTHWYTVIGAVFQPSDSAMTYYSGVGGCLYPISAGWFWAPVNLPDGAVAKYLYINYENVPGSSSSAVALGQYSYDGSFDTNLAWADARSFAATGSGRFFDLSEEITSTIDNYRNAYTFRWGGSIDQHLCSVQVGYYPPPLSSLFLPLVTRGS
jgi:hypothetical protein